MIESFAHLDWSRSPFGRLCEDPGDTVRAGKQLWELIDGTRCLSVFAEDLKLPDIQRRALGRMIRLSVNPTSLEPWIRLIQSIDLRERLGEIHASVLVVHRRDDPVVDVSHGRFLVDALPIATYLEIPGRDHVPWANDLDVIMLEVERFVTGRISDSSALREHTVLFTDIVESTSRLAALGDRTWATLLQRHDEIAEELLETCGGRLLKSLGDGLVAEVPSPEIGVRCAREIAARVNELGLSVRVGVHVGPCESYGADPIGLTVNIAARILGEAEPNQTLVSTDIRRRLPEDSDLKLQSAGHRALKGVPGAWEVHAVVR